MIIQTCVLSGLLPCLFMAGCREQDNSSHREVAVDSPGARMPRVIFKTMAAATKENTRKYTLNDDQVREVEIRFADGCVGYRHLRGTAPDGTSKLTMAREVHEDQSSIQYEFGAKGLEKTHHFRKDKTLFLTESAQPSGASIKTFFAEDGLTMLAKADLQEKYYCFTAYVGSAGRERKHYVEEMVEPSESGTKTMTVTLMGSGETPEVRHILEQSTYQGEEGPSEPKLVAIESFLEDTWTVSRRVEVDKSFDLGSETVTGGYKVFVKGPDGRDWYVRYLNPDMKVLKMVDQTKKPEQVTINSIDGAATEKIDLSKPVSPLTAEQQKEIEGNIGESPHQHLARLLID